MKLKKEKNNDLSKQTETLEKQEMQELDDDALDDIAGAGNPFANVPRVPTQPIDDTLRNNG